MSLDPSAPDDPAAQAAAELARVQSQVESARLVLSRLLQEVVVAESRLGNSQAAQMLAANEQLVVTALRNQTEAEAAAQALARLSHSAERDLLTRLPNRALLLDRFQQAMALARRHEGRLALLFLDLDNFKQVNDTLGHAAGDEILKVVAHRLVTTVRDADTVSRHGGDEFLILLTEISQPADAGRIASKLVAALAAPSRVGDQVVRLTASIGISLFPDDGEDVQTLVERADTAMYRAKHRGFGSYAFHGPAADHPRLLELTPVAALRDPVSRHDLAVDHHRRQHAELREANERLVLAALSAQALQEAAQRAHQRQAEFLHLVADELANPMAPIRVAAAMLGQAKATEPLLPRAKAIIDQQVENMARLVGAVQQLAGAGSLAFTLKPQTIDLRAVVGAAILACRPAMDMRLQAFTAQLPETEVRVLGEAARLHQLACNLLNNASHHTPEGGQIALELVVREAVVELTVSDSGIGITALALPSIFEPFAQDVHAIGYNGKSAGAGNGIGLTVVRAIVEAHGGTVTARSAGTGCGSQFMVTLPLAQAVGHAADAADAATPS